MSATALRARPASSTANDRHAGTELKPISFPTPIPNHFGKQWGNKLVLEHELWLQGNNGRPLRVPSGSVVVIAQNCYQPVSRNDAMSLWPKLF